MIVFEVNALSVPSREELRVDPHRKMRESSAGRQSCIQQPAVKHGIAYGNSDARPTILLDQIRVPFTDLISGVSKVSFYEAPARLRKTITDIDPVLRVDCSLEGRAKVPVVNFDDLGVPQEQQSIRNYPEQV